MSSLDTIKLYDKGRRVSELVYWLTKEENNKATLVFLDYNNYNKDIKIRGGLIGSSYILDINNKACKVKSLNESLDSYMNMINRPKNPHMIINTTTNKDRSKVFNIKNKEVSISYPENSTIVERENMIYVYKNTEDGSSNFNNISEVYCKTDDGFFNIDLENKSAASFGTDSIIDYSEFRKNGNSLLDKVPKNILISPYDKEPIEAEYSYVSLGIPETGLYVRTEASAGPNSSIPSKVVSIYPLLYDPFDFANNSKKPFTLWAEDHANNHDGMIEFRRTIYELTDEESKEMINIIENADRSIPLIELGEISE